MKSHELMLNTHERFGLSEDGYKVALGCTLLWSHFNKTEIYKLLPKIGLRGADGRYMQHERITKVLAELVEAKKIVLLDDNITYLSLSDDLRQPLNRHILQNLDMDMLIQVVANVRGLGLLTPNFLNATHIGYKGVSIIRLLLLSGKDRRGLALLIQRLIEMGWWYESIMPTMLLPFDSEMAERMDAEIRSDLLAYALFWLNERLMVDFIPMAEWLYAQARRTPEWMNRDLRIAIAHYALMRGEMSEVSSLIEGINSPILHSLLAVAMVAEGEWQAGQQAFEVLFKSHPASGKRKSLFFDSINSFYLLALLAQDTPSHLELARKFCLAQAGKRNLGSDEYWGCWVHAIDVRQMKVKLDLSAIRLLREYPTEYTWMPWWQILLSAWLGREVIGEFRQDPRYVNGLRQRLEVCQFQLLLKQMADAEAVLSGKAPAAKFFVKPRLERWREILSALQALRQDSEPSAAATTVATKSRILWEIKISEKGELIDITPWQQKRLKRSWGVPKEISLSKLKTLADLAAEDAKLLPLMRADRHYDRRYNLILSSAIVALVGHPALVVNGRFEQTVELVERSPELELLRTGDKITLQITPTPRASRSYPPNIIAEDRREFDALNLITLIADGSQRLWLVRFNEAQQRAAQILADSVALPAKAPGVQEEIDKTLQALSSHFQVQADAEQASRQVESESRLRAELAPVGESIALRLVAAPLGIDGPRLPVANGRPRLMAAINGETVGTRRNLSAERKHLESIIDSFAFLDEIGDSGSSEWVIDDPEAALTLVEGLPGHPAIVGLDWPKGKPVRVVTVDSSKVGITVQKEHDWFRLSGQAQFDEGWVVKLETLLEAAAARSRFLPMGDGVYASLTVALKQKLNELASVTEIDKRGGKVPQIALAWLDELLDGIQLNASAEFRQAIERLHHAHALTPLLPKNLLADLRPYQEEGYQWAMRLAAAGMGGCLADDMGLGKTLQAIAILLARREGGAAIVIAPTSVCGNWLAEVNRFAPVLNARIYSEASELEREQMITSAAANDLLIVSYTLLQLAQERFAARHWHTVVLDEAQAIKNATTKRSLAVFDLSADFRLALSGTPIENRLAELWSIMRFVNPGLLGTMSRFNERIAGPIERNRDRAAQHLLKRLIGPFVLRRTKVQVLDDLPPRTELLLAVTPEGAEAAHYEALRRQAISSVDDLHANAQGTHAGQARFNILAQLTRLRRAACDPRLVTPELAIVGAKVQAFTELAVDLTANGHKTLVFSQFVDFLQILRTALDGVAIGYQYLDGTTPAAERSKRVAAFQAGEGDLFLISLKAGGFGLNLTIADYVVITDPWWNPAAEDQAMGRAHRIGQLRPVTVYRMVSKGSIEERIVNLHHDKRALADTILNDGDASTLPSTEDLIALIRGD
jgi:superfamily II DNA or RNA helicase